ncbi:type I glyceraldehyde-3-phosphate dehydrogenase, partial [Francisella tularensis subsp. holarctica]|nr:type I glyceraldehyde-3-phosphate dehydrogenase [Francisella tularensis subsp. holarctica]
ANNSVGYPQEELGSSEILGNSEGSLFEATQTKVTSLGYKSLVKVVSWYAIERSYTNQMVRLVEYFGAI